MKQTTVNVTLMAGTIALPGHGPARRRRAARLDGAGSRARHRATPRHHRRLPRLTAIAAVFLVACPLWAHERRTAPLVPAEMLDGQRLVDKVSRFSIQAPEGWTWLQVASGGSQYRNYAASNPNGLGYAVNVVETDLAWTEANAEDMQIGMAKKLRSDGFMVTLLSFRALDVPAQASYRFTWRVVLPSGAVMHRFGYELKHGSRVLSFTCFSENETEPAVFIAFVRSLQLL